MMFPRLMHICFVALLLSVSGLIIAQASDPVLLARGTEINLQIAQTLTSKHAYLGQRVELKVADDISVGGALLVPKNTRVLGTVTIGKAKEGARNNPHQVALQIDYIRLGDKHIALTGEHSNKAKVDVGNAVATTALFGLTGLSIMLENRTGEIKEGTVIKAFVAEDVLLPDLRTAAQSTPAPAAPGT
jgi:hypothetical protein